MKQILVMMVAVVCYTFGCVANDPSPSPEVEAQLRQYFQGKIGKTFNTRDLITPERNGDTVYGWVFVEINDRSYNFLLNVDAQNFVGLYGYGKLFFIQGFEEGIHHIEIKSD